MGSIFCAKFLAFALLVINYGGSHVSTVPSNLMLNFVLKVNSSRRYFGGLKINGRIDHQATVGAFRNYDRH